MFVLTLSLKRLFYHPNGQRIGFSRNYNELEILPSDSFKSISVYGN